MHESLLHEPLTQRDEPPAAVEDRAPAGRPCSRNSKFGNAALALAKRLAGHASVGLNWLLGPQTAEAFGILTYHRIVEPRRGAAEPAHNVRPERFRRQIAGLLDRGYVARPLRTVIAWRRQRKPVPPRTFVVTFDDGYESVYANAWPILRELGVPATLFLATAYLDQDGPFPFDGWATAVAEGSQISACRPLSTKQCREMAEDGLVELGAHTHTHQDFRNRPETLRRDLEISVDVLRTRFAVDEVTFAFPYGKPSAGYAGGELAEAARQAGVVCSLTTEMATVGPQSGPFQWGRFNVEPWDTAATLDAKLSGRYGWAAGLKERIAATLPHPTNDTTGGRRQRT